MGDSEAVHEPHGCEIEGYYDQLHHVVFLHLKSILDSDTLSKVIELRHRDVHDKGFLSLYSDAHSELVKALLLLFLTSHIVILVHPTLNLDLNYLQLFRNIENARLRTHNSICDALTDVPGLSRDWIKSGRPCSPRLLFYFEGFSGQESRKDLLENTKKYELLLEDQIYRFLRRSRIITNICGNSLFAVCNQMDYVYIETKDTFVRDEGDSLLENMLLQFCQKDDKKNSNTRTSVKESKSSRESRSFYTFLWNHLHLAQTKGFDDNVGRHNDVPVFERPSVNTFFNVLKQLRDVLFEGVPSDSGMDGKLLEDNLRNLIMSDNEDDASDFKNMTWDDVLDMPSAYESGAGGGDDSDDVDSSRDLAFDAFDQKDYGFRR